MKLFSEVRRLPLMTKMAISLLFWILLHYILIEFRNFLYPIFLAFLFSFLLLPLANFFEKKGLNRVFANIITILTGIAILYTLIFFIYSGLKGFVVNLPEMQSQAVHNVQNILKQLSFLNGSWEFITEPEVKEMIKNLFHFSGDTLNVLISATTSTVFSIFILPVYIFFTLFYRDKYKKFIIKLVPKGELQVAGKVIDKISLITGKYMTGVFIVVLILCVLNSVGFYIIGLKYAVLFGIIAAVINFIPYFGTILGYAIPFLFALLTGESPQLALGVFIQFVIVQFTENNILTPNIVGQMVRINPFFIIIGVVLGGNIWGIPGMFLIVPILAIAKIVCDHIPSLKAYGFLLGSEGAEEHSITRHKLRRFFNMRKE